MASIFCACAAQLLLQGRRRSLTLAPDAERTNRSRPPTSTTVRESSTLDDAPVRAPKARSVGRRTATPRSDEPLELRTGRCRFRATARRSELGDPIVRPGIIFGCAGSSDDRLHQPWLASRMTPCPEYKTRDRVARVVQKGAVPYLLRPRRASENIRLRARPHCPSCFETDRAARTERLRRPRPRGRLAVGREKQDAEHLVPRDDGDDERRLHAESARRAARPRAARLRWTEGHQQAAQALESRAREDFDACTPSRPSGWATRRAP